MDNKEIKDQFNLNKYLLVIGVYLLGTVLGVFVLGLLVKIVPSLKESPLINGGINFLAQYIFTFVGLLFVLKSDLKSDFQIARKDIKKYAIYLCFGFMLYMVANNITNVFMQLVGLNDTSQNQSSIESMFEFHSIANYILLFIVIVIMGPIVEELTFRKALIGISSKYLPNYASIIISGILFGLIHVLGGGDYLYSIPYVVMGLVFSSVYLFSNKNIYVVIGLHILNNLISYVMMMGEILQ